MYELPNELPQFAGRLPAFVSDPNPDIYLSDNYLVLDFETTSIEHGTALAGRNDLLLVCWSELDVRVRRRARAVWGNEFNQSELIAAIARASFVVAHNAKFELQWLRRCGIDLRKVLVYDTLLAEKVLAGNRKWQLSLEATSARRALGGKSPTASRLIKAGVCPSEIPVSMLEEYCAQDVALTEQVFLIQRQELSSLGLLSVAYSRNLVCPVLADIEFNGMYLDRARVPEVYDDYVGRYREAEKRFKAIAGTVNFKSPKQLSAFLYGDSENPETPSLNFAELTDRKGNPERTAAGGRKTDKHTIPKLVATTDAQKAFKAVMHEIQKLKVPVQNLEKMQAVIKDNPNDPRMYAVFNQAVTDTGRLSSSARNGGMQFHNFDRSFKKLFRARKDGFIVCEADAPQLEFRVAGFLGNDATAKSDIQTGLDVHKATAATLGVSRQSAKPFTFKPLYGGNSGTKRELKYFDYFRRRYDGIYREQSRWTMRVASDKYLVTPWGMRFYWPDTEITQSGYVTNTTQIFNYPVQSLATAEIIPLALVCLWHLVGRFGDDCLLVNTIHDSIIAEINPKHLDDYTHCVVHSFTVEIYSLLHKLYGIKFDFPLGVGIKTAHNWGDTKDELKFEPSEVPF